MLQPTEDAFVVLCTTPDEPTAHALARGLVERRLAACVNVLPGVTSYYEWQGAMQRDTETLLVVKTSLARLEDLESWLQRSHPYEVPEVIALPIVQGADTYLKWLADRAALPSGRE